MMAHKVRVRFAPSPTGMLHIGAARTALYCWLYATQSHGDFILRIEDTDKAREVEGAVDNIKQSLEWLGLGWSDTYNQSDRIEIYTEHARELIKKDLAYADPYSKAELDKFRQQAADKKQPFLFRDFRPKQSPEWKPGLPLRFKVPEPKAYKWQDVVRGQLSAGPEALDDIILIKSDGYPTYNFAHIVDDHLTNISHALRGDEFIASVPKYLALYEAFGWQPPQFVTVPPIFGRDGNKKLSKRDGAQAVLDYRQLGYLPEALNNFMALLGWNDGTEQEIYTLDELVGKFSLERIQKSGAKFDSQRLEWINSQHLRRLEPEQLLQRAEDFWPDSANTSSRELKSRLLQVERERIKTLGELKHLPAFFFQAPVISAQEIAALNDEFTDQTDGAVLKDWLKQVIKTIDETGDKQSARLEKALRAEAEKHQGPVGTLFSMLRVILTNADSTPPIWDLVHILGKTESTRRLNNVLGVLE